MLIVENEFLRCRVFFSDSGFSPWREVLTVFCYEAQKKCDLIHPVL